MFLLAKKIERKQWFAPVIKYTFFTLQEHGWVWEKKDFCHESFKKSNDIAESART